MTIQVLTKAAMNTPEYISINKLIKPTHVRLVAMRRPIMVPLINSSKYSMVRIGCHVIKPVDDIDGKIWTSLRRM